MTQTEKINSIANKFDAMEIEYDRYTGKYELKFLRVGDRNKAFWRLHNLGYTLIEEQTIHPMNKKGNRRYILKVKAKTGVVNETVRVT